MKLQPIKTKFAKLQIKSFLKCCYAQNISVVTGKAQLIDESKIQEMILSNTVQKNSNTRLQYPYLSRQGIKNFGKINGAINPLKYIQIPYQPKKSKESDQFFLQTKCTEKYKCLFKAF